MSGPYDQNIIQFRFIPWLEGLYSFREKLLSSCMYTREIIPIEGRENSREFCRPGLE
jgi:hypothetical protein